MPHTRGGLQLNSLRCADPHVDLPGIRPEAKVCGHLRHTRQSMLNANLVHLNAILRRHDDPGSEHGMPRVIQHAHPKTMADRRGVIEQELHPIATRPHHIHASIPIEVAVREHHLAHMTRHRALRRGHIMLREAP